MADTFGWVENPFVYLKNSKIKIFQKTLPRFVVPSRTKIFEKLSWRVFDFILKILAKINEKRFFHSVN
jgi:hypothetical protein